MSIHSYSQSWGPRATLNVYTMKETEEMLFWWNRTKACSLLKLKTGLWVQLSMASLLVYYYREIRKRKFRGVTWLEICNLLFHSELTLRCQLQGWVLSLGLKNKHKLVLSFPSIAYLFQVCSEDTHSCYFSEHKLNP